MKREKPVVIWNPSPCEISKCPCYDCLTKPLCTDLVTMNRAGKAFINNFRYEEKCSLFKKWYRYNNQAFYKRYVILQIIFDFEKRKACGYFDYHNQGKIT